jgi:hypothetical protein
MPRYQLLLQYADGRETALEHHAYAMLRVGDRIRLATEAWRVERSAPADDWRHAATLICRPEPPPA